MKATTTQQIDLEVDASGLTCPLPILKAKKALSQLESGQLLKVIATDQNSINDFTAFAKQTGHQILEQQFDGDKIIHIIRRR